jgi:hypothetical protein
MLVPYRIPAANESANLEAMEVADFAAQARRTQMRARWTGCITVLFVCGAACALMAQVVAVDPVEQPRRAAGYWQPMTSVCFCACGQTECNASIADEILDCTRRRDDRCVTVWKNTRCESGAFVDRFEPAAKTCR